MKAVAVLPEARESVCSVLNAGGINGFGGLLGINRPYALQFNLAYSPLVESVVTTVDQFSPKTGMASWVRVDIFTRIYEELESRDQKSGTTHHASMLDLLADPNVMIDGTSFGVTPPL